ncbi:MAG: CCA tRNA nucleotidyltransferase [Nitrososphaerota archaeon]|nr:CCA tRNA nucleotidyltransferase [Nitrososphaerota archaeon]MDG6922868.1 CCA tRNA nucleotidyltransferase [Nitrososphaerota archaeon]
MTDVIARASKLVTPSPTEKEKLESVSRKVKSRVESSLLETAPVPEVSLGGSFARGTWLKGSHDIDFFLLYPTDYPRNNLEREAISTAERALHGYQINLRYAEHPYVEGFVENVRVNIVPCYKVPIGEWKSAADRSPFHTKYISSKLDEALKLEARLFKKFVKASGVYGAEVKIQGFSGYVCEVLVLKYGSFASTLRGLASIKPNEVVSIEPYDNVLAALLKSPIVILDPVDTTRNLGAAISARNVAKLVFQARRFLAKPKLSFFVEKEVDGTPSMELAARTLVVRFKNSKRSPDILWGQLRKSTYSISSKLKSAGFEVLRCGAASNESSESAFLFLFSDLKIGRVHSRSGPEYFRADEVQNYFIRNRGKALATWIDEDGRVESVYFRKFDRASDALKDLLTSKLESAGVSEELRSEIAKGVRILNATHLVRKKDWLGKAASAITSEE